MTFERGGFFPFFKSLLLHDVESIVCFAGRVASQARRYDSVVIALAENEEYLVEALRALPGGVAYHVIKWVLRMRDALRWPRLVNGRRLFRTPARKLAAQFFQRNPLPTIQLATFPLKILKAASA